MITVASLAILRPTGPVVREAKPAYFAPAAGLAGRSIEEFGSRVSLVIVSRAM